MNRSHPCCARLTYNSDDKVTRITRGNEQTRFKYDAGQQRYERYDVKVEGGVTTYLTTQYIAGYEKVTRTGGNKPTLTEQKLYVGNLVITKRSNNTQDEYYLHKDHQGSTTTITNQHGNVVQQFTYDPWGKQTAAYSHSMLNDYIAPAASKGYTGHEGVDHLNIIHMNGRIYDPTIGRFLQADPHIQDPGNTQSFNRYAYVLNNPMSYTDPSGFFFKKIGEFFKKFWKPIVAIVVTVATYGAASSWVASWSATWGTAATATTSASLTAAGAAATGAIAGATGGFVGGALVTGSIRGAFKGALTGVIAGAAGGYANFGAISSFGNAIKRVGVAAIGGCGAGATSGSGCKDGAKLAAITQALTMGASELYRKVSVDYNESGEPHLWRKGQSDVGKQLAEEDLANVLSGKMKAPLSSDQSGFMKAVGEGPYMDAFAEFHDGLHGYSFVPADQFSLIATMPPSYAITVGAAMHPYAHHYYLFELLEKEERQQ
ncbi:MAG: hypothetical protein LPH21_16540 [Shewanella sp.]|nr:hypothetical protein [Shewanella sp.]